MASDRFNYIKDQILKTNATALSRLLCVPDTSISNWSKGKRDIPDYIAKTLELHVAEKLKNTEIPLTLTELFALSRLAEKRGQTVDTLLLSLIKNAISQKTTGTNTAPDDDGDPTTGQFHTRHRRDINYTEDLTGQTSHLNETTDNT